MISCFWEEFQLTNFNPMVSRKNALPINWVLYFWSPTLFPLREIGQLYRMEPEREKWPRDNLGHFVLLIEK